jgi:hypothetical protein
MRESRIAEDEAARAEEAAQADAAARLRTAGAPAAAGTDTYRRRSIRRRIEFAPAAVWPALCVR